MADNTPANTCPQKSSARLFEPPGALATYRQQVVRHERLDTGTVTEQQSVTGEVRKQQIEVAGGDPATRSENR